MLINQVNYPEQSFEVLPEAEKLELMITWFHERYEDPVHATSYDGREGGYQFQGGAPYNARNVLTAAFDDLVTQETIDLAVEFLEKDGLFQWVLIDRGDDQDIEEPFGDGSFADSAFAWSTSDELKEIMLERFDALEALLYEQAPPAPPPRDHNNPPSLLPDEDALLYERVNEIKTTILELRAEAAATEPDPQVVKPKSSRLKWLLAWVVGVVGGEAVGQLRPYLWSHKDDIISAANAAADAAMAWAQQLPPLF